ncbi:MAG: YidC/Oxa1 family membrane protein insertase, partial [Clostridiales bacterium]|nr:YidC/Oxa1 family membrane protein insertase [Clostridiales bacterium]
SGCLLPFIQLFLIWPIYRIVSGPLIYLSQVPKENVQAMIDLATEQGLITKSVRISEQIHIPLINVLNNNSDFLYECINKGYIAMGQLLDLHFLGMDLTQTPAWNPITIISDPKTYLPLLIFPILVILTTLLSMRMTNWLKPGYKEQKEAKEREKKNPARAGQTPTDQAEMTTKMMSWMMPVLMLFTTFTLPAAMGLYWVVGGIMGILTQILTYFMFTKPYELKKLEMEQKKAEAFKKNSSDKDANRKKNKKRK